MCLSVLLFTPVCIYQTNTSQYRLLSCLYLHLLIYLVLVYYTASGSLSEVQKLTTIELREGDGDVN